MLHNKGYVIYVNGQFYMWKMYYDDVLSVIYQMREESNLVWVVNLSSEKPKLIMIAGNISGADKMLQELIDNA
jgi:hypothetical protein